MNGTNPDGRDERLTAVLGRWKGVEPRPDFEALVWARIRNGEAAERPGWFDDARDWIFVRPAWATAMAASLAILIGALAGLVSAPPHRPHAEPLLHPQTLAGSYLALVERGAR